MLHNQSKKRKWVFVVNKRGEAKKHRTEWRVAATNYEMQVRTRPVQQAKEEVYAAMQYVPSFHCLVEERKDCEELRPKPRAKWVFVNNKRKAKTHRTECVAAKLSLYEMR